jgi:glycosyltransferase involved in cell wall biosynthesis
MNISYSSKPTILTFVAYYLPGYKSGGPVRTIANMVDHLGDEFNFRIVTMDRDFLDKEPYPDIEADTWNQVGKAQVYYASPESLTRAKISRLIRATQHDVLYLNSFFSPRFTVLPLLARWLGLLPEKPVVMAPRGEFSQGALALKHLKKIMFIHSAKIMGIYKNLRWQASSPYEEQDIVRTMGAKRAGHIFIAPNLPQKPTNTSEPVHNPRKTGDPLRVVFLSRISPKKNLDYALRVLAEVKVPVVFDIYGIVDDEPHWNQCKFLMSKLPVHIKAKYHGVIKHEAVAEILAAHDLFFLPTRGENYGHAIYEALAAGTPALISDQTPWQDLYRAGVGWVRSLNDIQAFVTIIEKHAATDVAELAVHRSRAKEYALRLAWSKEVITQNLNLFKSALQTWSPE